MLDSNKWASFVRAHRLSQNLNQAGFAKVMGVSQQTVSRWESGTQVPEAPMQDKLKAQLRVTALNSIAFWKHRVANATSIDVLIASDMTVIAASHRAKLLFAQGAEMAGTKFQDLIPHHEIKSGEGGKIHSIEQLREIGFFDGLIRSIRLEMEWHLQSGSCACNTDLWPVMTSDQTIVGHFIGAPVPIPADESGFRGIRVKKTDVRLNRDNHDD